MGEIEDLEVRLESRGHDLDAKRRIAEAPSLSVNLGEDLGELKVVGLRGRGLPGDAELVILLQTDRDCHRHHHYLQLSLERSPVSFQSYC